MRAHSGRLADRRIVFLLDSFALGGSERQALLLARYLQGVEGARVRFIAQDAGGPVREQAEAMGMATETRPWRRPRRTLASWRGRRAYARALRREGVDALLPITVEPCTLIGLIWRAAGAAAGIWRQGDPGISLRDKEIQRRAILGASHRVANAPIGREALVEVHGVAPASVEVIPNAVAPAAPLASAEVWRRRLGLEEEQPLVAMVGNFRWYKDHATLVRAWRHVVDASTQPTPVLAFAGREDETGAACRQIAAELDLDEHIRFLGFEADVSGLVNAADLGVLSGYQEGCPNGLLEPMYFGKAVVGTSSGGSAYAVGEEGAGRLVPREDPEALAQAILAYLEDPEARAQAGAAGRARIERVFSEQASGDAWTRLILDGLARAGRDRR